MRGQLEPRHAHKASAIGFPGSLFQEFSDGSVVGANVSDHVGLIYSLDTGQFCDHKYSCVALALKLYMLFGYILLVKNGV